MPGGLERVNVDRIIAGASIGRVGSLSEIVKGTVRAYSLVYREFLELSNARWYPGNRTPEEYSVIERLHGAVSGVTTILRAQLMTLTPELLERVEFGVRQNYYLDKNNSNPPQPAVIRPA